MNPGLSATSLFGMKFAILALVSSVLLAATMPWAFGYEKGRDALCSDQATSRDLRDLTEGADSSSGCLAGLGERKNIEILLFPQNLAVLEELILEGVVDTECQIRGLSLLGYAASMGNDSAAAMLIELGADPSFTDQNGKGVLFHALASGNDDVVRVVESVVPQPRLPNDDACSSLLYGAVVGANIRWISKLIDMSCDVDVRIENGATLLMLLPSKTHPNALKAAEILLDRGLDPLARDQDDRTALEIAVQQDNAQFVALINRYLVGSDQPDLDSHEND